MCIMLNILSISTVDQEVRYFNVLRAFLMFIKHASSNDLEFREVFWEEFSAYYKSQEKLLLDQDLRVALFEHVMFQSKSICAQENCYELKILTFKIILRSLLKFIDDTSREYPQLMFKLFASFVQVSLKTNEAISVDIYHILEEISIELRKKIISKKFTVAIQQCKVRYGIK
ncbi:uncharacterized protein LOC103523108 [Diaphorina citri]|uniref:Uncharacterized protein LOC103523108 n=1 Tax=Diaphorina citri TaxID=121845 RepID=A0A1S3DQU2_DIACI|nr:uncharacterized protein LOC103523108 [Diaphorina citri]